MTYFDQNALKLCHAFWRGRLRPGMTCVDATAGRGRDAAVLCELIGEAGHLFAFDIQPEAIESTRERLAGAGLLRGTIGVFGMLAVLAACAYPFLQLGIQYLLYKLTAFLASAASQGTKTVKPGRVRMREISSSA